MTVFVISDTHWGDIPILEHAQRPFQDVQEEVDFMVDLWNGTVERDDTVIHLGDVVARVDDQVKYAKSILSRLAGRKMLITGNYEAHLPDFMLQEMGFEEIFPYLEYREFFMIHRPQNAFDHNYKQLPVLHGHKHIETPIYTPEWGVNMSCEYWQFKPTPFETIERCFRKWKGSHFVEESF
jgi:calcineurin-like phosphoesterase family protein